MSDHDQQARLTLSERYLTVAVVAKLLKIHKTTVYKLIEQGELVGTNFGPRGGARRVPESSLADYLARRGIAFTFAAEPETTQTPAVLPLDEAPASRASAVPPTTADAPATTAA